MNFVNESCYQYEKMYVWYLSLPLGCVVVDTCGVKLFEIFGRTLLKFSIVLVKLSINLYSQFNKDLILGGNNIGSGSGSFLGNFSIVTTSLDNISIGANTNANADACCTDSSDCSNDNGCNCNERGTCAGADVVGSSSF